MGIGVIFELSLVLTNLLDDVHSLENLAKDNVAPIQPAGSDSGDELEEQAVTFERN